MRLRQHGHESFSRRVFDNTSLAVWTRQLAGLVAAGLPLERSRHAELGLHWQQAGHSLRAALWQTRFAGYIALDATGATVPVVRGPKRSIRRRAGRSSADRPGTETVCCAIGR